MHIKLLSNLKLNSVLEPKQSCTCSSPKSKPISLLCTLQRRRSSSLLNASSTKNSCHHFVLPLRPSLPPRSPNVLYVTFQIEIFAYTPPDYFVNHWPRWRSDHLRVTPSVRWMQGLAGEKNKTKHKLTAPKLERAGVAVHGEVHQTHGALGIYS